MIFLSKLFLRGRNDFATNDQKSAGCCDRIILAKLFICSNKFLNSLKTLYVIIHKPKSVSGKHPTFSVRVLLNHYIK